MTRTKKHEKTTNPEMPCDCPWCNPERARAEYLKKRAKRDFYDAKMTIIIELDPSGRAHCNFCRERIPKGSVRIAVYGWNISDKVCHTCVKKIAKMTEEDINGDVRRL